MSWSKISLVGALICLSAPVQAEPITDLPAWTQDFIQQALKGDADAMGALVSSAIAPGIDADAIKSGMKLAVNATHSLQAESAEQFNETNVGNVIKRINIAVVYPQNYMFYSFALGHHASGWLIYSFKADGNINNILNAPWPG